MVPLQTILTENTHCTLSVMISDSASEHAHLLLSNSVKPTCYAIFKIKECLSNVLIALINQVESVVFVNFCDQLKVIARSDLNLVS